MVPLMSPTISLDPLLRGGQCRQFTYPPPSRGGRMVELLALFVQVATAVDHSCQTQQAAHPSRLQKGPGLVGLLGVMEVEGGASAATPRETELHAQKRTVRMTAV